MKIFYHIFFILLSSMYALNGQEKIQVFETHFVKDKKVLFRIVPENKTVFKLIKTNAIKVVRYTLNENVLTNEVVINDMLRPYWESDTLNWMKLYRKDKNKMAFIYSALFQNKADPKLSVQKRESQEKMVYDLMLLSCDFDSDVAKACGLFFADSTINNAFKYVYKLAVYTNSTSVITKDINTITVDASALSVNKKIVGLAGKSKNKITTLSWKAVDYKSDYSGYTIERSEDSISFKKINISPVILLSSQFEKNKEYIFYNDTMPQSPKKYFYRIKGINFFGEESEPSNVITSYSSPILQSYPLIDTITVVQNRRVNIKWRMGNPEETDKLKYYFLMRSEKDNGVYKIIFGSKDKLRFTDHNPLASNFYKVAAITFNSDTIYSFSRMATIIDTISPATPIGLKANVDAKGNVNIKWKNNQETDLQGYKLFKANAINEEFVQLNNKFIKDTFFNDKLNLKTLSKKIYYSLSATDNNFNSSFKCLPIEVRRPDTIPPASPILRSVSPELKGVKIEFILSKSNDVMMHIISRKKESENNFVNIKSITQKDSIENYTDTTAECGRTYTYLISAIDEDDNISKSRPLIIKYETGFRKKLTTVNYTVDRTKKNISLIWEYNEKEIEKFILYRKRENGPLTIIKTVDGNTLSYVDKTPNIGNIYEYRIKAIMYNGAESIISDPIKIEY